MFCGIGILELNGTIILYGIAVAIILCLFAETGFSLNYLAFFKSKTTQKTWILIVSPFSDNIFFPNEISKVHSYEKLTNVALETLLNEPFTLDIE